MASGSFPVPGRVPPGSYRIEATFSAGEPMAAGKVVIVAHSQTSLSCDGFFTLMTVDSDD